MDVVSLVRGPRRLEPVARRLLERKTQVLQALAFEHSEISWRVEAMRTATSRSGPLPLLLTRPDAVRGSGCCCSCGDPLGPGDRYRCPACVAAAIRVLEALP